MRPILDPILRPELQELRAYTVPAQSYPVKLDANESPWPLPDSIQRHLAVELSRVDLHRYPDPRATALRDALAADLEAHPAELVIGNGSDEVISILLTALSRPRPGQARASILFPTPTFVMFRIGALAHGHEPIEVPLDARWQLDVEAMRTAIRTHQPNVIFLATPNNPTGNAFDEHAVELIAREAQGSLVVIDEAYRAFANKTLSRLFGAYANVAMLGTLSKIGLAAARIGWARLPRALAAEVDKVRSPYNLNALSQRVGCLALGPLRPVLDEHVARISEERHRLGGQLSMLPRLEVFPSAANFFLVRHDGDATALARWLEEHGILVRNFHPHGGQLTGCLRITIGTPEENDRLVEALGDALG